MSAGVPECPSALTPKSRNAFFFCWRKNYRILYSLSFLEALGHLGVQAFRRGDARQAAQPAARPSAENVGEFVYLFVLFCF